MKIRRAYPRGRLKRARLQKRLALAAMLAVAACAAFTLRPEPALQAFHAAAEPAGRMPTAPAVYRVAADATDATPSRARRVYPYSIVPGGVTSRAELARAVMADKVVAAHYAGFAVEKASLRTVAGARAVYVSYRKGGQVYWTAHKVTLAEGEAILSDGSNDIRARCGNRISETPQLPVESNGPDERELDTPLAPAGDAADGTPRQTASARDAVAHGKALALASFADGAGLLAAAPAHNGADQAGLASPPDAGGKRPLFAGLERSASRVAGQTTGSSTAGSNTAGSIAVGAATMHSNSSETGGASSSGSPDGAAGASPGATGAGASPSTGSNPGPGKPALPGQPPGRLPNGAAPAQPRDVPEPASLWLIGVAGAALLLQRRLASRRPR
jgi:hypothetical protein